MLIEFKKGSPKEVLSQFQEKLSARKMGQMVTFDLDGEDLKVTIQKLGTSHLSFSHKPAKKGFQWELTQEKIAFAHKAFKTEMMEKISRMVQDLGGVIT